MSTYSQDLPGQYPCPCLCRSSLKYDNETFIISNVSQYIDHGLHKS